MKTDLDEKDRLCEAINNNDLSTVESILKTNIKIFYCYIENFSDQPLGYIIYKRKFEMAELLFKYLDKQYTSWDQEVMYKAAFKNKVDVIKFCLDHGANIEAKDGNGRTALFGSIANNSKECFDLLIEFGANVNAKSKHHLTPLILASRTNKYEMAKRLLELGADPTVVTRRNGATALNSATTPDMKELIQKYL